jgi:hypothetical protein
LGNVGRKNCGEQVEDNKVSTSNNTDIFLLVKVMLNWTLPSDMLKDDFRAKISLGSNVILDNKVLSRFSFLQIKHDDDVY